VPPTHPGGGSPLTYAVVCQGLLDAEALASLPFCQAPQIERRVGRFFWGQRLGRADDALGGGVVAGAVDGLDDREFAAAEAEG
jgi:hypothetical protein